MRFVRHTTFALVLTALLGMPAFAQGTGSATSPPAGVTGTSVEADTSRENDGRFDWGWLGLLGLAGLIGLRRQPDVHRIDTVRSSAPR